MSATEPDILVVGGGPSGSIAAFDLAQKGYDVLLIDRVRHPRQTVGESLLPSIWRYLDHMGVSDAIERDGYVKKAGGVVCWGETISEISFRDFAYDRPGLHVERDTFDLLLLNAARGAGVKVREGVRAERFVEPADGGRGEVVLVEEDGVRSSVFPRVLVDASGQAGFLARLRDWRRLDPDFRFVSLWGYFAGSRYVGAGGVVRAFEEIASHPPMTFVSKLEGWGWSWHIPMRRLTSVGVNVPVELYREAVARHRSVEDYFLATCADTCYLRDLLSGATLANGEVRAIRDYSYATERIAGPGFFIVGDAAAFVDPIFSLGVVLAAYSGRLAAWAIDRTLRSPSQAERNRDLYARQMRGRYQLARAMALPSDKAEATADARTWFDFFSDSEKDLMWSAASMTTRSANVVRAADSEAVMTLKRQDLHALHFL